MTTNEKLSAQVIGELEQENKRLRKLNNHMLALLETALDRLEALKINIRAMVKLMNEEKKEAAICKAEGRQP